MLNPIIDAVRGGSPYEGVGVGPLLVGKSRHFHQGTLSPGEKRNRKVWDVGRWIRKYKYCFV